MNSKDGSSNSTHNLSAFHCESTSHWPEYREVSFALLFYILCFVHQIQDGNLQLLELFNAQMLIPTIFAMHLKVSDKQPNFAVFVSLQWDTSFGQMKWPLSKSPNWLSLRSLSTLFSRSAKHKGGGATLVGERLLGGKSNRPNFSPQLEWVIQEARPAGLSLKVCAHINGFKSLQAQLNKQILQHVKQR